MVGVICPDRLRPKVIIIEVVASLDPHTASQLVRIVLEKIAEGTDKFAILMSVGSRVDQACHTNLNHLMTIAAEHRSKVVLIISRPIQDWERLLYQSLGIRYFQEHNDAIVYLTEDEQASS